MANVTNPMHLVKRWSGASQTVTQAIQNASARTGVSFDYLMDKAKQESDFKADAKAGTSSATGLFQFIESTWLRAVKSYGDQFGLGHLAEKISMSGGKPVVTDAATKQKILELRNDPTTASNMVAAMTKDNANFLQNSLGGPVGENDLYLAHFLGLGGANQFLKARQSNPNQPAADLFPAAAKANKNVFFDQSGRKRSLDDVYNFFAQKFDDNDTNPVSTIASAKTGMPATRSFVLRETNGDVGLSLSPDVAASQGLAIRRWGDRQLLETMMTGMDSFGSQDKGNKIGTNLLSPYTAMVLAQLRLPDETTQAAAQNQQKDQETPFWS